MEPQAFASIDFSWATLRYAEVAHEDGHVRPLQLGSCDFDFDVTRALLYAESPDRLDVVIEALVDVFAEATSEQLRVVIHPPDAYTFVTVVPAALPRADRVQRFQQEAALLAGTEASEPLHVTAQTVQTEETHLDIEPVNVLAMPSALHVRFERVVDALPQTDLQWMLSTQAAARLFARDETSAAGREIAFSLAVGVYPTCTEFALLRNGQWYYSHYADTEDPVEAAYFATALLDRLDIPRSGVTRVGLYGIRVDTAAYAPFETVFDVVPEPVDPFGVLGLESQAGQGDFSAGGYGPCVGAALDRHIL